jgi:hypothetical protein
MINMEIMWNKWKFDEQLLWIVSGLSSTAAFGQKRPFVLTQETPLYPASAATEDRYEWA